MSYFDHAATTKPWPELLTLAIETAEDNWQNPASLHLQGQHQLQRLERSRKRLASLLTCRPDELIFTSSATEASNQAIFSVLQQRHPSGSFVLCGAGDHDATRVALHSWAERCGFEYKELPLCANGQYDLEALADILNSNCIFCSSLAVNNETGAINDLSAIRSLLFQKAPKALWHVDAVQLWCKGREVLNLEQLGADYVSLSGHKIHGPRGVGLLYVRRGRPIRPLILGGGQQLGLRSGTENPLAAEQLALAAELSSSKLAEDYAYCEALREQFLEAVADLDPVLPGPGREGQPRILSIAFPGLKADMLLTVLSHQGFMLSSSSACHRQRQSAVLSAMKLPPELLSSTIRVSFDPSNQPEEVEALSQAIHDAAAKFRLPIR